MDISKKKYVLGIQGSPRKNGNTKDLMEFMLKGASDNGAETELVYLRGLSYKGCSGCYNCKVNGANLGRCTVNDDMQDIYQKIEKADAVVFGSPIYFCGVTSEMKALIDRLFPYLSNDKLRGTKSAFIYTQNQINPDLYDWHFDANGRCLTYLGFEYPEILLSTDTLGEEVGRDMCFALKSLHTRKMKHKKESYPKDLSKAYDIGKNLVRSYLNESSIFNVST